MGLSDLVVVAPRCNVHDEAAIAYASHGRPVLDGLRVVDDIRDALADCVRSYATSSKLGIYRRQAAIPVRDAASEAVSLTPNGPVALVFGREDYGLKNNELLLFDRVVSIPADDVYPVMNLAAAVTVLCYEVRQAWLSHEGHPPLPMAIDGGMAADSQRQVLYDKLFDALDAIGFFFGPNPDHLKYALRHLFGRLDMGVNEADILIGMACQIRWYVDNHPREKDWSRKPDADSGA